MTKEIQGSVSPSNPIAVGLGELCVSNEPTVVMAAFALGSCVALCAYDLTAKVGGLAHIVLPNAPSFSRQSGEDSPGKYADRALPEIVQRLEQLGARSERLVFKLVGGAAVLSGSGLLGSTTGPLPGRLEVGRRNVQGVLSVLYRAGFFPTAADLGGPSGRTIYFWPTSGKMRVRTLRGEEREY
ncbi:MAG: chemotaxis protein CheD [Chloroflexota bacterium]|nr:chemotaxis protein CheD [Chloroflexota bacterium]